MPKAKITNLLTSLHDRFGDDLTSPQQQQLMEDLRNHVHKMRKNQ
jgi:hypothetical protein